MPASSKRVDAVRNMNVFKPSRVHEFTSSFEERDWLLNPPSLPGPPPPPADDLCDLRNQNHMMFGQDSSPPLLVPRGTAPLVTRSFLQQSHQSCSMEMASGYPCHVASNSGSSRRGQGPVCSSKNPGRLSSTAQSDTALLEQILEKPKLVVVEEPKERGMRFRYECEGRSAGSILGISSTENTKTQPSIEIQGPIEHIKKVTITVSLVTKDIPYRPHPHCLVGKDCPEGSGICVVTFNPHSNRSHSFANLGIQCVRRKELDVSLQKRRTQNIDPFKTGHSKTIEDMDMNVVRLCFQCELEWEDGRKDSLSPVVSNPIYDKKATTTSQLKINRLNICKGPCTGKTEIYMLCDKVQKDDIEIIFRRGSWEAKGEFAQTDVHRQIAIVFKSPPYQEQDVTEEVEVDVFLRRVSDHMDSEPVTFSYLPYNPDPYEVKRKRKIKTDSQVTDRPCVQAQSRNPAPIEPISISTPFHFSADEIGISEPLSVAPAIGELNYNAPMDVNLPIQNYDASDEDSDLINQLLDNPVLIELIFSPPVSTGFNQSLDANFANMDVNFNSGFGVDISQYNDFQFNAMVNESQNFQSNSHPQDGPSQLRQMKTEEDK